MSSRSDLIQVSFTFEGKRYYVYGKTKSEAREKAAAKKALLKANVREVSGERTVKQWAYTWLESYKSGTVGKAWYDETERFIRLHIVPALGDRRVRDIKPIDITSMMNRYSDRSESFCKTLLQITRQIFDAALDNDIIVKDPTRRVKVAKCKPKVGHRVITPLERELTLKTAAKYPQDGLFFLIMLFCGCRPQEVAALRMKNVDLDNKILHITEARKADDVIKNPKTESGNRDIPIPDYLYHYLAKLNKHPNDYVCTNTQGNMITRSSQNSLWKRFKREMEIENGAELFRNAIVEPTLAEDFVPYCYRHTYCTDLQDAGVPVTVAKQLMGHRDIKVTAEIYTHHSKQSFEDARKKINAYNGKNTTKGTTKGTTS